MDAAPNILSRAIDAAVALVNASGNEVLELSEGWSKVRQVVFMRQPLSDEIKAALAADKRLRFFSYDGAPHNPPHEGFVDDQEKVAISFPRPGSGASNKTAMT